MSYHDTLQSLRYQDEGELLEMMYDIDDCDAVQRIFDAAAKYLTELIEKPNQDPNILSEHEECRQIDNARRARELKSP